MVADLLAEFFGALAAAVLQGGHSLLCDDAGGGLPELFQRQRLQVGVAAGKGDKAGLHGDVEDIPDRGLFDVGGPRGEQFLVRVSGRGGPLNGVDGFSGQRCAGIQCFVGHSDRILLEVAKEATFVFESVSIFAVRALRRDREGLECSYDSAPGIRDQGRTLP